MPCCLKDNKLLIVGGAAALVAAIAYLRCGKKAAKPASDAELVRGTWALVSGDLQGAGDLFYATLFEMEPSLRTGVFGKSDMKLQALRLMQMVDGAIKLLDQPDTLIAALLKLGERHVHYNVKAEHYPVVGTALMATLKKALGDKLTPEATAAWGRIYGVIQDTMLKGAAKAQ
jgi:methyl-accepting chemotaxis protein